MFIQAGMVISDNRGRELECILHADAPMAEVTNRVLERVAIIGVMEVDAFSVREA